jgi:glycosyltransferase involved in cell wall biosynthesis
VKVVLDCTSVPRRPAGAGRYALELANALAVLASEPESDLRLVILERWGKLASLAGDRVEYVRAGPANRWARVVWEQTALPILLRRLQPDVCHSTHHSLPLLPVAARRVVTVHDLTFRLFPARYPWSSRHYMRWTTAAAMRSADAVIVPSEAVKRDLLRLKRPPRAAVHVIPEGVSPRFIAEATESSVASLRTRHALPGRFLLQLGTDEPGKNRALTVGAFEELGPEFPDLGLVFAGQKGWGEAAALPESVLDLGYVPDEDLPALYAAAEVFVFPSLYEGFGLPVLEAMAAGTPVVTAPGGACAEVAGDAALIVDPLTSSGLAAAIRTVLTDPTKRSALSRRGRARAAEFTWERTARETLAVYRAAASSG